MHAQAGWVGAHTLHALGRWVGTHTACTGSGGTHSEDTHCMHWVGRTLCMHRLAGWGHTHCMHLVGGGHTLTKDTHCMHWVGGWAHTLHALSGWGAHTVWG